jgi:hypothetical protein
MLKDGAIKVGQALDERPGPARPHRPRSNSGRRRLPILAEATEHQSPPT